jgi:hypothetical protein
MALTHYAGLPRITSQHPICRLVVRRLILPPHPQTLDKPQQSFSAPYRMIICWPVTRRQRQLWPRRQMMNAIVMAS